MKIEITAVKDGIYKDIDLPATYSQIEDLLQQLNSDGEINARGRYSTGYGSYGSTFNYHNCYIFELNYLAELVENFDYDKENKFIGAYHLVESKKMDKIEENLNVSEAINIAMNINQNNKVDYQPAPNAYILGEAYLENDWIPELENVVGDAYQWIMDHVNLEQVGEEIRERENGTFISGQYVTISEELDDLYDGSLRMPTKEEYAFKMEIGLKNEMESDGSSPRATLILPTNNETFRQLMRDFEVADLTELSDYSFQSTIPVLEHMDFGMEDIEILNQLAASIQYFKEIGEFNTYKAMIDALPVIDLERVNNLCDYTGEFTLIEKARNFAEYGRSKFQNILPDELLECLNTEDYGRKLAEKNGVTLTAYGALVPKDGVPLMEKVREQEQKQAQEMTME